MNNYLFICFFWKWTLNGKFLIVFSIELMLINGLMNKQKHHAFVFPCAKLQYAHNIPTFNICFINFFTFWVWEYIFHFFPSTLSIFTLESYPRRSASYAFLIASSKTIIFSAPSCSPILLEVWQL